MTVKEFIEYLKTQPQDILVAHRMCSEQCLLDKDSIEIVELGDPRPDGWIHDLWVKPEVKPTQKYLLLPGN